MGESDFPVAFAANLPGLVVRLGWAFLRLQTTRKRGVRAFKGALRAAGLPPEQAAQLAQKYHDAASLREIAAGVRKG